MIMMGSLHDQANITQVSGSNFDGTAYFTMMKKSNDELDITSTGLERWTEKWLEWWLEK